MKIRREFSIKLKFSISEFPYDMVDMDVNLNVNEKKIGRKSFMCPKRKRVCMWMDRRRTKKGVVEANEKTQIS